MTKTRNLEIKTATIEIKVVRVDGHKMTMATFRQLEEFDAYIMSARWKAMSDGEFESAYRAKQFTDEELNDPRRPPSDRHDTKARPQYIGLG